MNDSNNANRRSNARLGLILFAIYSALYAGFVFINALSAATMDVVVIMGLNLAIVYGFALIVIAVVMAFIYGMMCKRDDT